jgi:hypothetical protein
MKTNNAENERIKRAYFAYLKEARRYSDGSSRSPFCGDNAAPSRFSASDVSNLSSMISIKAGPSVIAFAHTRASSSASSVVTRRLVISPRLSVVIEVPMDNPLGRVAVIVQEQHDCIARSPAKGRQFLGRHLEGAVADERNRTP